MSKLNINRNVFLEKEELSNFQNFLGPGNLLFQVLVQASYSFGLVTNNPSKMNVGYTQPSTPLTGWVDPFIVQQGTNAGTIKVLPGLAITSLGNVISINVEDNIVVTNNSSFYWVKIGYKTRNYETGYVSINTKGVVSGTTSFSGKLRGQSTSTPVSIRFEKLDGSVPLNNGIYQVVNIIDNQNLVLTSASAFTAEANLRVVILGTLPLGGIITQDQRNGLYTYDYYTISLIPEVSVNTPPSKDDNEYYIARVQNAGGTITIQNTVKSEYWALGNALLTTKP